MLKISTTWASCYYILYITLYVVCNHVIGVCPSLTVLLLVVNHQVVVDGHIVHPFNFCLPCMGFVWRESVSPLALPPLHEIKMMRSHTTHSSSVTLLRRSWSRRVSFIYQKHNIMHLATTIYIFIHRLTFHHPS